MVIIGVYPEACPNLRFLFGVLFQVLFLVSRFCFLGFAGIGLALLLLPRCCRLATLCGLLLGSCRKTQCSA